MVIWIIGISGSGKTTIGKALSKKFRNLKKKTIFIDGDEIRKVWGDDLGYAIKDRKKNHSRLSKLCKLIAQDDVIVIVAALSIFVNLRHWNKKNIPKYYEVLLDTPIDTVIKRDPKSLYAKRNKNKIKDLVGIDIKFPKSSSTDLTINKDKIHTSVNNITNIIFSAIKKRFNVK